MKRSTYLYGLTHQGFTSGFYPLRESLRLLALMREKHGWHGCYLTQVKVGWPT